MNLTILRHFRTPGEYFLNFDRINTDVFLAWNNSLPLFYFRKIWFFKHLDRVPTAPGKPGKMVTVFPAWKNPGILSFLPNILEK